MTIAVTVGAVIGVREKPRARTEDPNMMCVPRPVVTPVPVTMDEATPVSLFYVRLTVLSPP